MSKKKSIDFIDHESEEYQEWLEKLAEECMCCPKCWDVPCGSCQAGGICDAMCICDKDNWIEYEHTKRK